MNKNLKWKLLIILGVVVYCFILAYPPFTIDTPKGEREGKIKLGLDLQGGMHLVLKVDLKDLPEDAREDAPERALEVIRNRIDQFGVSEPIIQKQGGDRILIQLPGVTDRERALSIVGQTALLEFKLVSDDPALLRQALEGNVPAGYELKYLEKRPLLLEEKASLTGKYLVDASMQFETQRFNMPMVSLEFDQEGAAIFASVTGDNVGRQLAIVLDGKVQSAPVINEKIPSGRAQISGNFSVDQASDLAIVLRAGALPAPIIIEEERTVGPTLGQDSVRQGIRAILVGGAAVIAFMAIYYLYAGLIANFALFLNILIIGGALSYFHATLTLPGIAGIVLVIGMAVDANVLIFERIREELRIGKPLKASIASGYSKAFRTILDSNVTTLISAVILFQFGTGPIRGFALTLSIGIIASLFTAIFVTRGIFDLLLATGKIKKLPMLSMLKKEAHVNFVGKRKLAYLLSLILIVAGLVVFANRGERNFGVDFTGGTLQQFRFQNPVNVEEVRSALKGIGLGDAAIQEFGGEREVLVRTMGYEIEQIKGTFQEEFPNNPFEVMRVEKVGPAVGEELRKKALSALLFALLGICIYVSFRFEFKFAVAAIIALAHDALITLGFLAFTGREISLPVIAALLTVLGYSINDTIVIFDRIREDLKLYRKESLAQIINISINQTLSRTILTSTTTLLVVLSLFFLGGEVIRDFSFVLLVGVLVGTYSSIFVASPIILEWPSRRRKR